MDDPFIWQFFHAFPPGALAAALPLTLLVALAFTPVGVGKAVGAMVGLAVVGAGAVAMMVAAVLCAGLALVLFAALVACGIFVIRARSE